MSKPTSLGDWLGTNAGKKAKDSIEAQVAAGPKFQDVVARSVKTVQKDPPTRMPLLECPDGQPVRPNFFDVPSHDEEKLNKTEKAWLAQLRLLKYPAIGIQAITLKLGDDCRFTPDFNALGPSGEMIFWDVKAAWKVKGSEERKVHVEDDALAKIKFAARTYRWARFILVYKLKSGWQEKEIRP